MGVAIDVPGFHTVPQFKSPITPLLLALWISPTATTSGLKRPSGVGPLLENQDSLSVPSSTFWEEPTVSTFLAVPGDPTVCAREMTNVRQ
jgi:hypothetical protein